MFQTGVISSNWDPFLLKVEIFPATGLLCLDLEGSTGSKTNAPPVRWTCQGCTTGAGGCQLFACAVACRGIWEPMLVGSPWLFQAFRICHLFIPIQDDDPNWPIFVGDGLKQPTTRVLALLKPLVPETPLTKPCEMGISKKPRRVWEKHENATNTPYGNLTFLESCLLIDYLHLFTMISLF